MSISMQIKKFVKFLHISIQDIERKRNSEGNSGIVKGSNSVTNVRKMMCFNPNLDLLNINAYTKLVKFYECAVKILCGNQNMTDGMTE